MKCVMFYELAADGLEKFQANFLAHQSRLREFQANGTLLMAGPYGTPPLGALAIFTSCEAVESFIAGDPFVQNGVVGEHSIHEWSEALTP